jgi:predicted MFS family arabinose efflux permease
MPPATPLRKQRDFLSLWTGQAISQIGSRITREGLPLTAVLTLGASPMQMGILNGAGAAAVLIFGLFAGAWVDRVRRRPILIASDLGRAALLASVPAAALLHRLTIAHLCLVASAAAVLTVFFDVAYQAYVPSLVDRGLLVEANSKLALTESIAEVSGPGLTGILVQWLTAPIAIAFDAISFLVSAASLWWIGAPEPQPKRDSGQHIVREIREGLRVCRSNPILRALLLRTAAGAFFGGFIGGLYVLYAIRNLGLNALLIGLVVAAGGASSLFGAFLAPRLVNRLGVGPALIAAAAVSGASCLLLPLAHGPVAACCAWLVAAQAGDAAWPIASVCDLSLRQAVAPPGMLGRVNSAMHLMFRGLLPAGAVLGGALAGATGVRGAIATGGAGVLLSTLFLVFSPIRGLRELPTPAERNTPGANERAAAADHAAPEP